MPHTLLLFYKLSVWCSCFLHKIKFKINHFVYTLIMLQYDLNHSDTCMLFSCLFLKTIERVAFFPWHTILWLEISIVSIPGSFGGHLKFRWWLSSPEISTKAISCFHDTPPSYLWLSKEYLAGWHLRRFNWLCDSPHELWVSQKPGVRMSQKSGLLRSALNRNSPVPFQFHPFTLTPALTWNHMTKKQVQRKHYQRDMINGLSFVQTWPLLSSILRP